MGQWDKFVFQPRIACLTITCSDKPAEKVGTEVNWFCQSWCCFDWFLYTIIIKQHMCLFYFQQPFFVTSLSILYCRLLCNWKKVLGIGVYTSENAQKGLERIGILRSKHCRKFPKPNQEGFCEWFLWVVFFFFFTLYSVRHVQRMAEAARLGRSNWKLGQSGLKYITIHMWSHIEVSNVSKNKRVHILSHEGEAKYF